MMSYIDYIILALSIFVYGGTLGATIAWAWAKMEQCDYLEKANRELHHQIKIERISKDHEHYFRHRDKTTN